MVFVLLFIGPSSQFVLGDLESPFSVKYLTSFPIDWGIEWEKRNESTTLLDCKTIEEFVLLEDLSLQIGGYPI